MNTHTHIQHKYILLYFFKIYKGFFFCSIEYKLSFKNKIKVRSSIICCHSLIFI